MASGYPPGLAIQKFLGMTEQPLYQQPPGKLKDLVNFRVTKDGLLEANGGHEKLQSSGGTATAPISSGFYTGAHEHASPVSWIVTFDGTSTYSNNLSLQAYYPYFAGTAVGNRLYFISPNKWSRMVFLVGTAGTGGYGVAWKYIDSGGVAQTLSGVTEDFKTLGTRTVSFTPPATWGGASTVNGAYGYAIYVETTTAVIGTIPKQKDQRVQVDWEGMKQIYVASSDGASGTANGTVKRFGLSGSTASWATITSSLTSGSDPRIRFASWRGYLYFLNGVEQKRYNMDSVADIGFSTPTGSLTTALGGGTGLTGTFHHAVTYGYGAAGELGESNAIFTTVTKAATNQDITVTLSGLTSVPAAGTVDVIYVYRSVDLSSVAAVSTSIGAFPFYRVKTVTRDGTGAFPATVQDSIMAVPQPVKTLNTVAIDPPSNCQFVAVHRSRMFLARNNAYPGRVWWSKAFEPESFNQDEDFADFTRQTGGIVTGMVEFADQIVVFTDDAMYGVANVDQDPPNIYLIAAGIGCIAPDSVKADFGYLCWLSRHGIYVWDGTNPPRAVSEEMPVTMNNLSREAYGGSRGIIYDRIYEVSLISPSNSVVNNYKYRYDLSSGTWSRKFLNLSDTNITGLMTFTAPNVHEAAGQRFPLYGKVQSTGSNFHVYVGDYKTVDDGSIIPYSLLAHFGPANNYVVQPKRVAAVWRNPPTTGWDATTLVLSLSQSSYIGDTPGLGAVFTDGSLDYSISQAQVSSMVSYTGDLVMTFSISSKSGGTAKRQSVIALFLDGNIYPQPMRTS